MRRNPLGIYEKALPPGLSWPERLAVAKACGFDFVEISIDETDTRLARLDWVRRAWCGAGRPETAGWRQSPG